MLLPPGRAGLRPGLAFFRHPRFMHRPPSRGFTLVEMVVVLVLAGILATLAAERFFNRDTFDASACAEQTRAMLRYGQKLAVAQQRRVYVLLDSGKAALCYAPGPACAPGSRVLAPAGANSGSKATIASCGAGDWYCEGRGANLASTVSVMPFYFDALGRPVAADPTASFATAGLRISGGGLAEVVTIVAETGYVY